MVVVELMIRTLPILDRGRILPVFLLVSLAVRLSSINNNMVHLRGEEVPPCKTIIMQLPPLLECLAVEGGTPYPCRLSRVAMIATAPRLVERGDTAHNNNNMETEVQLLEVQCHSI